MQFHWSNLGIYNRITIGNVFQIFFILHLVGYKRLKVNDWYVYPDWAYSLGWSMTLSSVLLVPLWAAGQMCFTPGTFKQVCAWRRDSSDNSSENQNQSTSKQHKHQSHLPLKHSVQPFWWLALRWLFWSPIENEQVLFGIFSVDFEVIGLYYNMFLSLFEILSTACNGVDISIWNQ